MAGEGNGTISPSPHLPFSLSFSRRLERLLRQGADLRLEVVSRGGFLRRFGITLGNEYQLY